MASRVGAVIVTHDSGAIVAAAVAALAASSRPPDRVLVVDSGTTDPGSQHVLDGLPPAAEVIAEPGNVGFCAANNHGIAALGEVDLVLLCNPDCLVDPAFLAGAIDHLETHPRTAAIGPRLLTIDGVTTEPTGTIDSTGIVQTWYGRFLDRDQGRPATAKTSSGPPVVALCAAAVLLRCAALDEVGTADGPFDEAFFMHKEDIDLGLRLRRAGWAVDYRDDLVALHARGTSAAGRRQADRATRRRSVRNEWRIWRRATLPASRRLTMLPYLVVKAGLVALGR